MAHSIYGTIILILFVMICFSLPYTKRGYDQTVIEKYAANYTTNMGDLK